MGVIRKLSDFSDAFASKALVEETAFNLSLQLMLRAIFLKINSSEAHKLLKDQLLEQAEVVAKMWVDIQHGEIREGYMNGVFDDEQFHALEARMAELENTLVKATSAHIEAVFEVPDDVAGVL